MGRRSENTEYLKGTISDALLQLMENTPIDKITVREITDLAGVGRMTYFRHFRSKTEVLSFKLQLLWKIWLGNHPCTYEIGSYEHALWFFSFWYSIRRLLSLLYRQKQYDALLQMFLLYAASMEDGSGREQYQEVFFAYGLLGIVMKWTATEFQETPERLAALCTQCAA